ncbi:MAG TPA: hypothetical protein VGK48_23735 [Terriglobia bacterium]|jgi:hypothetical protein
MTVWISGILDTWASFYSNHAMMRTLIGFLHIGGLVIGGGCAISADRLTLLAARRGSAERTNQLGMLRGTHRIVLISLSAVIVSGLFLFAADTGTFLHSILFWVKMAMIGVLMANGLLLVRAERLAESGTVQAWRTLTITSTVSVVLWMLTTLAGAALPNIG